jgi:ATP:ADP antiporter, AAA family
MYPLIGLFQKTAIDTRTQIRIIRIIGKIDTETAQRFLYSKLEYPNKWIVMEVVNSLIGKKHLVVDSETAFVDKAIYSAIGASAWLLAMTVSLEDLNSQSPVKRALDEEYQVTLDLLFKLLELKYSEGVIQQVRKYVMSDSANEQRELGVEMLSFVVEEEIKKYLFPLLHNNRSREKVLQLQELYPIRQKEAVVALREIINSDLGIVSLWTKACALSVYIEMMDVSVSEDVYAQVFHPEPLLSEIAFLGIYKWNRKVSLELFERLPNHRKKKLKAIMDKGVHHSYKTLFHKVECLQKFSYFEKIKGHHLIPLAEALNEHFLEAGGSAFVQCSEEEVLPVFMIPFGEVVLIDLHKRKYKLNRDNIYGLGLYAGTLTLSAFTDSVIYMVRPEQVGSLVLNHEDLSDALYQYIQKSNFY